MIKKNKVLLSILAIVLLFSGALFIYLQTGENSGKTFSSIVKEKTQEVANKLSSPIVTVQAGFLDGNRKKVPVNSKILDFTFSEDLDISTITLDNFNISPSIEGVLTLVNGNVITFTPNQQLNSGEEYIVTLSHDILTSSGNTINETIFEIETVAEAKVVTLTPNGNLQNLDQNFVVIFNVPMVPLTDLDSRDQLPCLINFQPKVEGKCIWTTTSVLEFIPTNGLYGSTKYQITVDNKQGTLYDLSEKYETEIQTPELNFYFNDSFSVTDGISFRSNFDVDIQEVEKAFILSTKEESLDSSNNSDQKTIDTYSELPVTITKENNRFTVQLNKGSFTYETRYYIQMKGEVNSLHGNIPYIHEKKKSIKSRGFLNNIQAFMNIYSQTGALEDTQYIGVNNNVDKGQNISDGFPIKNVFFHLSFEEEVPLDKKYFTLSDVTGKEIDFSIEYVKELVDEEKNIGDKSTNSNILNNNSKKEQENKSKVKLEIKSILQNDTKYSLTISKNINKYLGSDIIKTVTTSKKLTISSLDFLNYKKSCLYINNQLQTEQFGLDTVVITTPETRSINANSGEYISSDEIRKKAETIKDYSQKKLYLASEGYCAEPINGDNLYVLNTRFNPNSDYTISIQNTLEDVVGNVLEKVFTKKITTGEIQEEDKYLYSSIDNSINTIPENLPIVLNLQSINLDSVDLEICEMNSALYLEYVSNRGNEGYNYSCIDKTNANITLVNRNWNLSNNRFDLEEDILEHEFKTNFVLVKGKKTNTDIGFEQVYIRESLSLVVEYAGNNKLLFVTDYEGNQVTDINFKFFKAEYKDKENLKNILEVKLVPKLNEQTKVFELDSDYGLFDFVMVQSKQDPSQLGFVNIDSDGLSNYSFNYISGSSSSEKRFLYLYTERPIYKPGDSVFVKGLLRDFIATGYIPTDIEKGTIDLIGPSGKVIASNEISVGKNSNFDTTFVIPSEVELGTFRFEFNEISGKNKYTVQNNAFFDIEEYVKPAFKVNIVNNDSSEKNDYTLGENFTLSVEPEYYFGGKMSNTSGSYSVMAQSYYFDAKDYSDYQFGEGYGYFNCIYWGSCSYNDNLESTGEFVIDGDGKYNYEYDFKGEDLEGEKVYTFNFEVLDPDTQKAVTKSIYKVLHNTDGYVGLKANYYNNIASGVDILAIVLDFEAQPLSGKDVTVELIKKEWKSVKKKGVDGIFYNDYSLESKLESSFDFTSDKKGEISQNIKPKQSGEYEIKMIYTGNNGESTSSSREIYIAGTDYVEWHNDNNDVTELVSEKVQVKIGDTAEYMLKSPINKGKALIVIEKDNDILDYFVHDITSFSDKISIDVIDTYYPNYYIKAFLIGSQENNPLPVYKRALAITKVNTEYKKLNLDIKTDKQQYLPGEKVSLEVIVTDVNGKAVANTDLSLSLVDESLLALKGNPQKNPYAFFYDLKRYLGITTYSSLSNLIDKLEVKGTGNGEKGGAGDETKGGDSNKKRGTFKDTAFWEANVTTDEKGVAKIITTELPDNLTTWVIEALANTSNDTKIGVNYETIITSKSLLINDNLPQFLGSNDSIVLSPVIFNKTGKDKEFSVELEMSNVEIISKKIQKITIKNGESNTVNFEVKVHDIGISDNASYFHSQVNIKAYSTDNTESDEVEKFLQIKEISTPEAVSTFGKTDQTSFEEKIELGAIKKGTGKLTINYSATLLTAIIDGVEHLQQYPYGSSAGITSAIMPNVFIKQLYNSVGSDFDLETKKVQYWVSNLDGYGEKSVDQIIKEYLVNIRKYQKNDGGFVYYYDTTNGENTSDFLLTSYILESGAQMEKIGYTLDKKTYDTSVEYLKARFYKNYREGCQIDTYNDCKYSEVSRLKALSAILEYAPQDYEAYKMYKIIDFSKVYSSLNLEKAKVIAQLLDINNISDSEKEILRNEAKSIVSKIMNEELVFNPRGAYIGKSQTYSRFQNTTTLLEVISTIGLEEFSNIEKLTDNMIRWIVAQKSNGSFGSDYNNISLIKAVTKYLVSSGELKNINNSTLLKLNNKIIAEKIFTNENKLETYSTSMKLDTIQDSNSFVVEKTGNGNIYYDLVLEYYKDAAQIMQRDEGFFVDVAYYLYDDYKKIESLKKIEWEKYRNNEISYKELIYSKNIFEYITPKTSGKVGEVLIARNTVVTNEVRDKVSFESFIPSGAELINPHVDTSGDTNLSENYFYFNKQEYRTDRVYGYKETTYPGSIEFNYLFRLTHEGTYSVKPTRVTEIENVEVFGRNAGKAFTIEK